VSIQLVIKIRRSAWRAPPMSTAKVSVKFVIKSRISAWCAPPMSTAKVSVKFVIKSRISAWCAAETLIARMGRNAKIPGQLSHSAARYLNLDKTAAAIKGETATQSSLAIGRHILALVR